MIMEPDYKKLFLDAAEILETYEFMHDDNPTSNSCWECGAKVEGTSLPIHKEKCPKKLLLDIAKKDK